MCTRFITKSLYWLCLICAGAIALAEVLAESRVLEYIDVRDNDIRIAGLMALSLAHRLNHQILHLSVPKNIKCDPVRLCGCVHVMCLFVWVCPCDVPVCVGVSM